jgi:tRNA(His) guanylyltransferase
MTESLGDRMRQYINVSNTRLIQRMPVIIFVDGKKFHNYTRSMEKPFSDNLIYNMQITARALCEEIQGSKLAYIQSDEISILLHNYDKLNQGAYFDFRTQKMASIAASTATLEFNRFGRLGQLPYGARFDARCFNVPKEEVCNYFIWRQKDWTRNSVQMLARSKFSNKALYKKDQNEMKDMLMDIGINWNDLPTQNKRGSCVIKSNDNWAIDQGIPIFTQDRNYIERFI